MASARKTTRSPVAGATNATTTFNSGSGGGGNSDGDIDSESDEDEDDEVSQAEGELKMRALAQVDLLKATCGADVMALLLSSERVYSDMLVSEVVVGESMLALPLVLVGGTVLYWCSCTDLLFAASTSQPTLDISNARIV